MTTSTKTRRADGEHQRQLDQLAALTETRKRLGMALRKLPDVSKAARDDERDTAHSFRERQHKLRWTRQAVTTRLLAVTYKVHRMRSRLDNSSSVDGA